MANLWLWFPCTEERRQYVIELLGLESVSRDVLELRNEYLYSLEDGKTRSPWYRLERLFYMNKTEKYRHQKLAFMEYQVWEKGFRRIYTQNSYYFRPGHWLVLKLRNNAAGRLVRKHVLETFPPSRMGTSVPLPREAEMFLQLRRVRGILGDYRAWLEMDKPKPKLLEAASQMAEEIMQACPQLFNGDDVYLWEEMARYWEGCGEIDKAARCLNTQAQLQPGKTDAWLNLGAMYYQAKWWGAAAAAYLKGLRFEPNDHYLTHNLNLILANDSATAEALDYLDFLVTNYPDPFHALISGDMLYMLGRIEEAAARYQEGADLAEPGNRAGLRCLTGLAGIYLAKKDYNRARLALEPALESWPNDDLSLSMAVELYSATGDAARLKKYARLLVKVNPDSAAGQEALARFQAGTDNTSGLKVLPGGRKKASR